MPRRSREAIHVWPVFSDLMSGLAVLLLLFTIRIDQQRRDAVTLRMESEQRARAFEAALATCNEARKQYGVRQRIVEDIRARLHEKRIEVSINQLGNLEIAADMLFPINESEIPPAQLDDARAIGRALVALLRESIGSSVAMLLVTGHTDQEGAADDNLGLSTRRAASLVKLWQGDNLPLRELDHTQRCMAGKIVAAGMGETRPVVPDEAAGSTSGACGNLPADRRGCRRNRRIEIRVIAKDASADDGSDCR